MARPRPVDLETFVRQQDASMLASVLLELAGEHQAVQKRLMRWQLAGQPDKLASAFRKTLAGWRRATRFLGYPEARGFGLEAWLDQIEKELTPRRLCAPGPNHSQLDALLRAAAAAPDHGKLTPWRFS